MKPLLISFIYCLFLLQPGISQLGNVGINTSSPAAMLHVKDSSVLFTGLMPLPGPGKPPASGAGTRLMWYPDKAAFRVGSVTGTAWNKDNIGSYSFASGHDAKAKGEAATALGYGTNASGTRSTAIGSETTATGHASFAGGSETTAKGQHTSAMGTFTMARSFASFVIGRYNDTTGVSSTTWIASDPLFIVGNGMSNTGRANALTVLKNGNIGIGMINPGFPLNFSSTIGDKISLSGNAGNHFGFGMQSALLQIHTDVSTSDIAFGYGSSASFTERIRIKGNGNLGLGTSTPGFPLNFSNSLGDKIALWGNSGPHYGFGIQNNLLQIHTDVITSDVAIGYGTSSAFTETMRIKGNGNVGIANNNPVYKLDVTGRMRLRHSTDGTPGIWFNKSDNSAPIAFMGLFNNEYVGLYGDQGSSWNFLMSTITGNVGIGLSAPTQKLHVNGNGLFSGTVMATKGSSGAAANGNAVGILEDNSSAYLNILTPTTNESGILFGNPVSSAHGGILYNSPTTPNALQFRVNGNVIRMTLTGTGSLGLGTTNPITPLHVRVGNSGADPSSADLATFESNDNAYINLSAPAESSSGIWFNHPLPAETGAILYNQGSVEDGFRFQLGTNTVAMVINDFGHVGIGTSAPAEQFHVVANGKFGGFVMASCGVLSCSDIRYKTNITPLRNVLSVIKTLSGVYYHWNKGTFPEIQFNDKRQIGIIAQELEDVFPEIVHTDTSGYKTVDYSRLSPILLEAIKEQQQIIDFQSSRLDLLLNQIDILSYEINKLKEAYREIGSR